jgi:hypothetical protein
MYNLRISALYFKANTYEQDNLLLYMNVGGE